MSRRVRLEVYDQANPHTLVTTLSTDSDRSWQDVLNDVGSGSVTVGADDPQVGDLDCRNYVRCLLDGLERFAWLIEGRQRQTIPRDGKPSSRTLTVSGRGVLALLEGAVVYPELGTERLSPDTRLFNFASADYTENLNWHAAREIKFQSAAATTPPLLTGQWDGAPLDWPVNSGAYWIWGRVQSNSSPPQPVGRCYFRKEFTVAVETTVRIFLSSDDGFELYLDGALVAQETRAFMWAETKQVDVLLDAGNHLLAAVGVNIHRDSVSSNVAGFVLAAVEMTEGGESYGAVVVKTDSSWRALGYPPVAPTMTPGEIFRVLLDEVRMRGGLLGITLGCTDSRDSNGALWAEPVDLEVPVGTSYLQVLHTLIEMSIDAQMTADLELQLFNRGTLGDDRTASVALEEGVHLSELTHRSECPIMNAALIKLHTGSGTANVLTGSSYTGAAEGDSIDANGRLEAYLEIGTAPSEDQASRTVAAAFDEHATEQVTVGFQVEERGQGGVFVTDERPYVGWQVGDVILAPGMDDLLTDTTVLSLSVTDDPSTGPDPVFRAEGTQTPIVGS